MENRKEMLQLIDAQTDLIEKSAVAHGIDERIRRQSRC
jgi:hypothetical protein